MKHKRTLALALALAVLLSCTGITPVWAASSKQTGSKETAQAPQDTPAEKLEAPQFVDSDQFEQNDHVERLYHEERMDTYVYRNSDGTKSVYYMGQNVKYKDKNGNVRDKDTTLVRGDRGYRMRDNDVELHLPDSPADGITLEHSSRRVKLLPQGGKSSANLEDNSIIYPGYFGAETALRYTPLLSGVKEDIILSRYTGENRFSFVLETGGLHLYEKDGQYYLAENENAEAAFYLGQVVVYDAMGRPDEGGMAVETLVPGQKYRLTLSADVNFLTDPETVYPVTIDPTLTVGYTVQGVNAIVDAPIYEGKPNSNYSNYVYDRVGYYNDEYKTARTVMRPDALLSSNEWASITKFDIVSLKLYVKESSGKSGKQVDVHALTGNSTWTESNVTWNNVGAYYPTPYASAILGNDDWAEFDLTSLAVAWKTIIDLQFLQIAQCGFLLKLADESVYRTIYSCEYSTVDYRPYVVLEYAEELSLNYSTMDITEGSSFTLTATTQLGTPEDLSWTSSDERIATVSTNGVVTGLKAGKVTITATYADAESKECTVYVTIPDGLYYIRNALSGLCLQENGSGANINSQITGNTERISQLWKITYISSGNYVVRPLRDLSSVLQLGNTNVSIADSAADDTEVPYTSRIKIVYNGSGYAFKYVNDETRAMLPIVASAPSSPIYCSSYQSSATYHWVLEEAEGVFLRDTSTLQAVTSTTVKYLELGQTYTLSDLDIACEYYGNLVGEQSWSPSDSPVVSVDTSTGEITAKGSGIMQITISVTISDSVYSSSYSVLIADKIFFLDNYYDTSFATDSRLVPLISDAVSFINIGYYKCFSYGFAASASPTFTSDFHIEDCTTGVRNLCDSSICGSNCETSHHKSRYRILNQLADFDRLPNHISVLWCNWSAYCVVDSETGEHRASTAIAQASIGKLATHMMIILGGTERDLRICMSLVLAHEIAHNMGLSEVNNIIDGHEHEGSYHCAMEVYETSNMAHLTFYEEVLSGTTPLFCDYCQEQLTTLLSNTYESE